MATLTTRTAFKTEMLAMDDHAMAMADLVTGALQRAVQALSAYDLDAARAVVAEDERVNQLWARIERETMAIIARQQPMASDLREILAVSAIATDLERIGDHAKSIGNTVLGLQQAPDPNLMVNILRMADLARSFLAGQMTAFAHRDADAARAVAARDNEIDALYYTIYKSMIAAMMTRGPEAIHDLNRLLWVAKSLERVGDHTTNIGERIVFLVSGEFTELNP